MPRVDLVVETKVSRSPRARQLEGMFDVPPAEKARLEWHADVPFEAKPWNVGLIVGPSGAGKSLIAKQLFGDLVDVPLTWKGKSVIDDFRPNLSIEDVTKACQAVGFNTVPAWLRPFKVLSNGEQFRAEMARRILELDDPIVVDEFTSVVDRQVAEIASHAVQKFVRKRKRQLVAVTCHYDVVDWLQPDWVFEPATRKFKRRRLRQRPKLDITISRIPGRAWEIFAPFHYMTATINAACRCFGLWMNGTLAGFAAMLHRPQSSRYKPIIGGSRIVVLPDFQGLGLAFVLAEAIGSALLALDFRFRVYPAHPHFVRAYVRSPHWKIIRPPGLFTTSKRAHELKATGATHGGYTFGGRANAIVEYVGPSMGDKDQAKSLWGDVISDL